MNNQMNNQDEEEDYEQKAQEIFNLINTYRKNPR